MYTAVAAALASVCQSVCQRRLLLAHGVRADSMRTCVVLQIHEWSASRTGRCARALAVVQSSQWTENTTSSVKTLKVTRKLFCRLKITQKRWKQSSYRMYEMHMHLAICTVIHGNTLCVSACVDSLIRVSSRVQGRLVVLYYHLSFSYALCSWTFAIKSCNLTFTVCEQTW